MNQVESASKEPGGAPLPEIDRWSDRLGGLLERYPKFWIGLGNWESSLLQDRLSKAKLDQPIYIAGLARSGSTILLELLARHPETASHRYRDFPLVLTPWIWNWFVDRAGQTRQEASERAHRDRIKVTPESPEAFEEVIWMAFFPELHEMGGDAVFGAHERNPQIETFYRDHIRKLLTLRGAERYLSKGNYNVTRLPYLKRLFPGARFVVPIRDPVWHIASLIKQHRLFVEWEGKDPRVLDHMRRTGHFEFGLNRQPINFGEDGSAAEVSALWAAGEEVEGWAAHWASVYGHVAEIQEDSELTEATLVLRYEDMCANPGATFAGLLDHCGLEDFGLTKIARDTVSAPAYYEPSFSEAERGIIRERTESIARRFGYN